MIVFAFSPSLYWIGSSLISLMNSRCTLQCRHNDQKIVYKYSNMTLSLGLMYIHFQKNVNVNKQICYLHTFEIFAANSKSNFVSCNQIVVT